MKEKLRQVNIKEGMYALFLGVITSMGLFLSLTAEVTEKNSPDILMDNKTMVFVRTVYCSLSGDRLKTLLAAVAVAAVIYFGRKIYRSYGEKILTFLCAVVFAMAQLVAYSYKKIASWDLLFETDVNEFRGLWKGLALAVIFYYMIPILRCIATEILVQDQREEAKPSLKSFLQMTALMFLCWLPYLYWFYPGTGNEDTVIQMMEYFQIPSYIQDMSPMPDGYTYMTNHHPYLLTLLFSVFFRLGLTLGDIRIGIAIYSVCHMLFLAMVFSGCMQYMRKIGVSKKRVGYMLVFFMVFPIFPLYSICMVKDTIYSAFALICILMMYEVARTKGKILGSKKFDGALFVVALLMMLTKVFGMYILALVGIYYLIRYRKYAFRVVVSLILPIFLYKVVFLGWVLPACNVAPGGIQEALSVPFQQTARYVCEYEDEVTEEEREAIDAILPYDDLKDLYEPELSDEVKKQYNQYASKEELLDYFKVWFQMFTKHPDVYVESLLNNTYQYYDINKMSNLEYYRFDEYLMEQDEDREYTQLYVEHNEDTEVCRYVINQVVLLLQKIPFVNIFLSLGMLPWIMLFFFLYNLSTNRKQEMALLIVPLLTIAVCMVSPDNGNSRYVMPMIFLLPFLYAIELLPVQKDGDAAFRET